MAEYYLSAFADESGKELDTQIAALQRNGIRFMEIRGVDNGKIELQADSTVREIRKKTDAAGIGFSALGSALGKSEIEKPFGPSLENLKRDCEICEMLGTKRIRMFSYFIPKEKNVRDYREEVLERLHRLCDYAASQGITLLHENEALIYGEKPEEVLDIRANEPRLGHIYDPSNYQMADADPGFCIENILPFTDYLHIKDCTKDHVIVPADYGDTRMGEAILRHSELKKGDSFLVLEPHLKAFMGYSEMDSHELKNKFHFENHTESFDCAVRSLKALLQKIGFTEGENGKWKK